MVSKFDYLTLSIKSSEYDVTQTLEYLRNELLLNDLFDKMEYKGSPSFFDFCYAYNNISLLYTLPERYAEQGICLKFSGTGLEYFQGYLKSYGMDLKLWLAKFRTMSFRGFITKCTRLDYACDDIVRNDEKPLLTMRKIRNSILKGEVVKKAKVMSIVEDGEVKKNIKIKNVDGVPMVGTTLYIGSRSSAFIVRFYDKLVEQLQKGVSVPSDVKSWVRCEFEFHDSQAMAVLNAFLDMSVDGFADFMCGVMNDKIRFISKTDTNISRCKSRRWWVSFLRGCNDKFTLPKGKPCRSALAKAKKGLKQYARTINSLYKAIGLDGIIEFFANEIENRKQNGKSIINDEIIQNVKDDMNDYQVYRASELYSTTSTLSVNDFLQVCNEQWFNYRDYRDKVDKFDYIHDCFMNGQDFLYDCV